MPLSECKYRSYECRCDCGATSVLRASHFVPERRFCTRSCPLLSEHKSWELTGKKFARWAVVSYAGRGQRNRKTWNCVCECGTHRVKDTSSLTTGASLSCGCLAVELNSKNYTLEEKRAYQAEFARKSRLKSPSRSVNRKINCEQRRVTPSWLTDADWCVMDEVYFEAKRLTKATGVKHEVDHRIPLNGKFVSGLHVPGNLQILTKSENSAKSNRYAEPLGDQRTRRIKSRRKELID